MFIIVPLVLLLASLVLNEIFVIGMKKTSQDNGESEEEEEK